MLGCSEGQVGVPGIPRKDIYEGGSMQLGDAEENYKGKPLFWWKREKITALIKTILCTIWTVEDCIW